MDKLAVLKEDPVQVFFLRLELEADHEVIPRLIMHEAVMV